MEREGVSCHRSYQSTARPCPCRSNTSGAMYSGVPQNDVAPALIIECVQKGDDDDEVKRKRDVSREWVVV